MTQGAVDVMLYGLAQKCVERNDLKGCGKEGCAVCEYNVFAYNLPINDAALLKATATAAYYDRQELRNKVLLKESAYTWGPVLALAAIVLLVIFCCSSCAKPKPVDEGPVLSIIEYETFKLKKEESYRLILPEKEYKDMKTRSDILYGLLNSKAYWSEEMLNDTSEADRLWKIRWLLLGMAEDE